MVRFIRMLNLINVSYIMSIDSFFNIKTHTGLINEKLCILGYTFTGTILLYLNVRNPFAEYCTRVTVHLVLIQRLDISDFTQPKILPTPHISRYRVTRQLCQLRRINFPVYLWLLYCPAAPPACDNARFSFTPGPARPVITKWCQRPFRQNIVSEKNEVLC